MISSAQLRAARSLLGNSQTDLAERAGVSVPTLKRAEGASAIRAAVDSMEAIQRALESAGVEFIPENGGGIGVRPRKIPA
jgi:transcriptional regulator with XRE-family HTH domain